VRGRTLKLRAWAIEVAERARSTRELSGLTCNHAAEVEQVQQALHEVEAELSGLRTAMETRAVIEQAKGMLMAQRGIDAEEAFGVLVQLSQTTHRKLVDVATVLVDTWRAPHHGDS
jgi:Cu/Ag efflux pump CusA